MIHQRLRTVLLSIGMAGTVFLISGCSHSSGEPAPAATPAPVTDPKAQQAIAQHAAGAAFDAQQRGAMAAKMKAAAGK